MVTKFFPTIVTSTCNRTVEMENVHVTETAAAACRLVVALIRREGKGKENQLLLAQRERERWNDRPVSFSSLLPTGTSCVARGGDEYHGKLRDAPFRIQLGSQRPHHLYVRAPEAVATKPACLLGPSLSRAPTEHQNASHPM